jgi:DNA processing protein
MITANFATDYGRQVFAVPGRIDSPRSKGCHELLKKGAKLCEGLDDVLPEFEYLFPPPNRPAGAAAAAGPALTLSEPEEAVLRALGTEEREADEILREVGMPTAAVNVALFSLEMKRMIRQLPGRRFRRFSGGEG